MVRRWLLDQVSEIACYDARITPQSGSTMFFCPTKVAEPRRRRLPDGVLSALMGRTLVARLTSGGDASYPTDVACHQAVTTLACPGWSPRHPDDATRIGDGNPGDRCVCYVVVASSCENWEP